MINQHGAKEKTLVVDQFEATDFGAPFKIILKGCVKVVSDAETGATLSYTIPDPDGLQRMLVFARIMHPRKLHGADIKFLRKSVGVKQKDVAKGIGVSPEHLCKCEADKLPLSPTSDRLLRLFLFKTVIKHHKINDKKAKAKIEEILDVLFDDLEPEAVYDVDEELVFAFQRKERAIPAGNDDEPEYELEQNVA